MFLIQLPEEILIFIVKKLDLQSQINLYETCLYLSKIVTLCGVVKECSIPPGRLASPNLFKSDFFKGVIGHLKVLNLCAVQGLTRSTLIPALKKLKYLETLDVSYTKIVIPDLGDIKKSCPTVKSISISFLFGKHKMGVRITQKVLAQCQDVFQHFENVEFVGVKGNLMQSQLPFYLLRKASLNNVKFTVIKSNHTVYQSEKCDKLFKFNHFQLLLLPWNQVSNIPSPLEMYNILLLPMFDMNNIEYIVMLMYNDGIGVKHIYTSALLKNFVEEHHIMNDEPMYNEPIGDLSRLDDIDLSKNVIYLIWNKATTTFNETFFSELWSRIKCLLPSHTSTSCIPEIPPPPKDIDWYFICVEYNDSAALVRKHNEPLSKKKRVGVINHLLDFDDHLKEIKKLKLNLYFLLSPTVCLNAGSNYLKKLTYLSLMGRVQFNKDFFKVIFECCEVLETFNVEVDLMPIAKSISNSISLSSSLKNFRLAEKTDGDNINILLRSLGECKSLENVHIFNKNCTYTALKDFSFLVEKCKNLYSLYVRHVMSEIARNNIIKSLNSTKTILGKSYLNLELYSSLSGHNYVYLGDSYDPYLDVFKLNPLKRI